jgi:hypothetical protein
MIIIVDLMESGRLFDISLMTALRSVDKNCGRASSMRDNMNEILYRNNSHSFQPVLFRDRPEMVIRVEREDERLRFEDERMTDLIAEDACS